MTSFVNLDPFGLRKIHQALTKKAALNKAQKESAAEAEKRFDSFAGGVSCGMLGEGIKVDIVDGYCYITRYSFGSSRDVEVFRLSNLRDDQKEAIAKLAAK